MREQVPHLAVGPAPELGRIDEHEMIGLAAARLARDELLRIIEDPADGRGAEPGCGLVLLGPRDRLLRRIDVRHLLRRPPRRAARPPPCRRRGSKRAASPREFLASRSSIHSQCGSCSGKSPSGESSRAGTASSRPAPGAASSPARGLSMRQRPLSSSSSPENTALAFSQARFSSRGVHNACGSGRSTRTSPKRSSLRPLPSRAARNREIRPSR